MSQRDNPNIDVADDFILRRQVRNRSLRINALGSFVIKGAAMIVSLCAMPVYMQFFGDESVLGVWFTLLSLINWILMFDFGIGNGLRNKLTIAITYDDRITVCKLISSSYVLLGAVSFAGLIVCGIVMRTIDWNMIFGISVEILPSADLLKSMLIIFTAIWLQFYLRLVTGILFAIQKATVPSLLTLITNILLLVSAIIYKPSLSSTALFYLSVTYALSSILPLLVTTIIVFKLSLPYYTFHISDCSMHHAKEVSSIGLHFFFLQILSMAVFNSREVLISHLVGASSVVDYTVYYKVYSLISTFFLLALTPFWSAITEAYSRHDYSWIKSVYYKGLVALISFTGVGIVLLFAFPFAVHLWLGESAPDPDLITGILFVLFNIEYMFINLNAHVENGTERLHVQTIGYLLSAVLLIIFSIVTVNIWPSWTSIVFSSVLSLIPMSIMQAIEIKRFFITWK